MNNEAAFVPPQMPYLLRAATKLCIKLVEALLNYLIQRRITSVFILLTAVPSHGCTVEAVISLIRLSLTSTPHRSLTHFQQYPCVKYTIAVAAVRKQPLGL